MVKAKNILDIKESNVISFRVCLIWFILSYDFERYWLVYEA